MCISIIKIQSLVHYVESKQVYFCKLAYLTFDFKTLILGQLQNHINTYHVYKYHQDSIIGSLYIQGIQISFLYKFTYLTLTFDLDLRSTSTSH